jgi:predicted HicB family RNase H-like nuclease
MGAETVLNPRRRSNSALRLQPSLMEEAPKAAEPEGAALNQLINVAVAETRVPPT